MEDFTAYLAPSPFVARRAAVEHARVDIAAAVELDLREASGSPSAMRFRRDDESFARAPSSESAAGTAAVVARSAEPDEFARGNASLRSLDTRSLVYEMDSFLTRAGDQLGSPVARAETTARSQLHSSGARTATSSPFVRPDAASAEAVASAAATAATDGGATGASFASPHSTYAQLVRANLAARAAASPYLTAAMGLAPPVEPVSPSSATDASRSGTAPARATASPTRDLLGMYSTAFVAELQANYESQLSAMRAELTDLSASAERENATLRAELDQARAASHSLAGSLQSELDDARRAQLLFTVEMDNVRHAEQTAYHAALADLERKHADELDRVHARASADKSEQREWYVRQVQDAEAARDAATHGAADERRVIEHELRAFIESLRAAHHEEVLGLHRALGVETEALAAARAELHTANEARRRELQDLRDKFEQCIRVVAAKETHFASELARARQDAEMERARLTAEREAAERALDHERELAAVHRDELERKFARMDEAIRAMEVRHADHQRLADSALARQRADADARIADLEVTAAGASDARFDARRAEQECALLRAELELQRAELARLGARAADAEAEVRRLDSIVYGSTQSHSSLSASMATSTARRGASTTQSAVAPRRREVTAAAVATSLNRPRTRA